MTTPEHRRSKVVIAFLALVALAFFALWLNERHDKNAREADALLLIKQTRQLAYKTCQTGNVTRAKIDASNAASYALAKEVAVRFGHFAETAARGRDDSAVTARARNDEKTYQHDKKLAQSYRTDADGLEKVAANVRRIVLGQRDCAALYPDVAGGR